MESVGAQCLDANAFPSSIPSPPVKGFSIIEEMAKAVYRRAFFTRMEKERASVDANLIRLKYFPTRFLLDKSYHPSYIYLLMAFRVTSHCKDFGKIEV